MAVDAGANAGVLNQVAVAKPNGYAYGASGAVLNSGGVSIGGDNNAYPTVASVDLCASAMSGDACGNSPADALGELRLSIGAVAGLAQTPKGFGKRGSTQYGIAGVTLNMTSPLLAGLLKQVDSAFSTLVTTLTTTLKQAPVTLPAACRLSYDKTMSFDGGAVTLNGADGTLTFDLARLVKIVAGKDINALPANTDLVGYLLKYLADPNGLAKGIQDFLDGITKPLQDRFTACSTALDIPAVQQVEGLFSTLTGQLTSGQTQVKGAVDQVLSGLGGNSG